MDKETFEALGRIMTGLSQRGNLSIAEEKAMSQVGGWMDEVAKEIE